ncbi:uncharacterized protein LOC135844221 [Planococcus citri]|uniref:uncharacterized protein LOC135844221 n=1 Tax=Planococcus citri TaxID=170843 RepID=UPI0031F76A01
MFNVVKWFAGFTVMQVMKNQFSNVVCEEANCTVSKLADNQTYADCSNLQLTSVRRGLGAEITIMNISSNNFVTLKNDDLSEYTRLEELIMKDLKPITVSQDFLTPLVKLEVLDISGSTLIDAPKFPSSITILIADSITGITGYDFSNLGILWEISLNNNNLEKLPNLNRNAPLAIIYLNENNIKELDIVDLGRFCSLTNLYLDKFASGEKYANSCCFVRVWCDEYRIESALKCEITCEKDKYPASSEAIEAYNECYRKRDEFIDIFEWQHVFLYILVVVIFIVIILIIGIKFYWSEDDPETHPTTTQKTVTEKEPDPAEDKDEAVVEEENVEASH